MSRSTRAGLLVLGFLSTVDLLVPFLTDGEHPPMPVALAAAVLGAASLALVVPAWRGSRRAVAGLLVLRALSALAAVPAAVMPGVPGPVVVLAVAGVLATLAGAALVLAPRIKAGTR